MKGLHLIPPRDIPPRDNPSRGIQLRRLPSRRMPPPDLPLWRAFWIGLALILCALCASATDVGVALAQQENEAGETIGQIYIVQPRDSLTKIARNVFGGQVSANDIYNATNAKAAVDSSFARLANPNVIVSGQKLWIPTTRAVAVTGESSTGASQAVEGAVESAAATEASSQVTLAAVVEAPPFIPQLSIADQALGADHIVTVNEMAMAEAGTLSIALNANDASERIIGQVPVAAGTSVDVQVVLSETVPFGTLLFATLATADRAAAPASSTALLPPSTVASTSFRVGLNASELAAQDMLTILSSTEEFGVLYSALQAAGLTEGLQETGPFTLYIPTNAAFSRLSEEQLELLLTDMVTLEDVLRYHIVSGRVESANLRGSRDMPTLSGGVLTLRNETDGLFVGDAGVLFADMPASNGVIYAIDQVLLPPIFNERLAAAQTAVPTPELN